MPLTFTIQKATKSMLFLLPCLMSYDQKMDTGVAVVSGQPVLKNRRRTCGMGKSQITREPQCNQHSHPGRMWGAREPLPIATPGQGEDTFVCTLHARVFHQKMARPNNGWYMSARVMMVLLIHQHFNKFISSPGCLNTGLQEGVTLFVTPNVVSKLTATIAVTICITIIIQKMDRLIPGAGNRPVSA